jgi:hypothetical protein
MNAREGRRLVRTAALAVVLTALTLGGHAAGSGRLPDALGLGIVCAISLLLARAVGTHALSLPRLVAFLLGTQALLHMVLTVSHAHGGAAHGPSAGAMVLGHAVAAVVAATVLTRADAVADRWCAYLASTIATWRLAAVALPTRSPGVVRHGAVGVSRLHSLRHRLVRRGPPRVVALIVA